MTKFHTPTSFPTHSTKREWIGGVLTLLLLPTHAEAQPSNDVARRMVNTIEDVRFSAVAVLRRANTIPAPDLQACFDAFKAATQEVTGVETVGSDRELDFAIALNQYLGRTEFHRDGVFQRALADAAVARLRSIDRPSYDQWNRVISDRRDSRRGIGIMNIGDARLNSAPITFFLLRIGSLFSGGTFSTARSASLLSRLTSLDLTDAIARWQSVLESSNIDEAFTAASLIQVDALFANDAFRQEVFDAALPRAELLIQQARAAPRP